MHCREILFSPPYSPRAREFPRSRQLFVRRTVAELRDVKVVQFLISAYFPHTKPLNVPSGNQPTAQVLHRIMITIFPCGSKVPKGVLSGSRVFLRLLVGELGTPKFCPNFCLWQMAIPIENATTRRVRSGPKMSENVQF